MPTLAVNKALRDLAVERQPRREADASLAKAIVYRHRWTST
jgi:hypothetical protein